MHNLQVVDVSKVLRSFDTQDLLVDRLDEGVCDGNGSQNSSGKAENV